MQDFSAMLSHFFLYIVMLRVVKCLSIVGEAIVDFDTIYIWLTASSMW